MKNTTLAIHIVLILLISASCNMDRESHIAGERILQTGDPESVGMSTERLNRIDPVVEAYVQKKWISGATAIIARHGKIVYHKSLGMRAMAIMPLLYEPGEEYTYGLNTDLLGYLIEVVSGQSLDLFFRERIFEPLGMNSSSFFLEGDQEHRLVSLYEPIGDGGLQASTDRDYYYPIEVGKSYFSGGGGIAFNSRGLL